MGIESELRDSREFNARLFAALESLQITYAIGGSVAAMCYSVAPRLTQDVDVMVDLDLAQLKLLVAEVERWESYLDPLESIVQDLLPMRMPIKILDGRIGARADVYVVKHDGLDASAMQRRRRLKLYTRPDVYAWVLAPEDVILYKLLFFAASRGVSQKHVRDIHGILRAIEHDLDTNYRICLPGHRRLPAEIKFNQAAQTHHRGQQHAEINALS